MPEVQDGSVLIHHKTNKSKHHPLIHMNNIKPIRESLSFKRNESHLLDSRDALCQHYRLNKSDLVKYLIKKESFNLKNPQGTFCNLPPNYSIDKQMVPQSLNLQGNSPYQETQ